MCAFSGLLIGFLLGVVASILATLSWELWTRRQLHQVAKNLAGTWTAHEMLDGRTVDRSTLMKNAWPTIMKAKSCSLSAASHILEINAADTSGEGGVRPHKGYLVIDRVRPWLATRIVFYSDSDEVSEQHIIISLDRKTLHVLPVAPLPSPYNRHALCRVD